MAKFLNTSATNYFLEELIKNTADKLILISPYLKLNNRLKELLEDKNRLKIDIRIVYGKNELQHKEINWLNKLSFIRTSFCENLHAKCYMNEKKGIITSLNLYEFSQVNNNEMGILISRTDDAQLYKDAYEEAQRIIRISDEIRISMEKISLIPSIPENTPIPEASSKITTSKLAKKLDKKTDELLEILVGKSYLIFTNNKHQLTSKGKQAGGEHKKGRFGDYFLWSNHFDL